MLEIEMSEHPKADYDYQTTIATFISVARRAKTIFENSSDIAGKRAFLNYILQNPIVADKQLSLELRKPFDLVLNWLTLNQKQLPFLATILLGSGTGTYPLGHKLRVSIQNK